MRDAGQEGWGTGEMLYRRDREGWMQERRDAEQTGEMLYSRNWKGGMQDRRDA